MSNFNKLDEALNIESSIVSVDEIQTDIVEESSIETNSTSEIVDIKKDYEYTRSNLYSLIEKGQEAINGILELAGEGSSPRAYEVAGQLNKECRRCNR